LERCIASGKTILELKKDFDGLPVPYAKSVKQIIWLDRENEDLEKRIAGRTESMLHNGLLEETENLVAKGILNNSPASNSVGYRECISCLNGGLNREQLPDAINYSTRRLVAKQRKWFRKHLGMDSRIILGEENEISDPKKWNWLRCT
jgi:tRNA dimethylallyltransferase